MKLDLGCGPFPAKGYEGVDLVGYDGKVKHAWDLEQHPWPWKDSSVDALCSSHLVEHIRDLNGFMAEAHRVLKPGGEFQIFHPYQFNVRAWQDPTHVRCLNEVSWFYYDKEWRGGRNGEGFGDTDFELVELDAIPEENWKDIAAEFPEEFERACRNQVNVISDLHVTLRCRK